MSHGPKVVRKVWSEWVCEDRAVVPGIEISSFPRVQQVSCNAHVQIPENKSKFIYTRRLICKKRKKKKKEKKKGRNTTMPTHLFCKFEMSRFDLVFSEVIRLPSLETNLDASTVDFSGGPVVPDGMFVNLLP